MDPKEILKELVTSILEWEEADAVRARVLDSKRSTEAEIKAANTRMVASIRKLRLVAQKVRKMMSGKTLKKKGKFDWLAALKVTSAALNAVVGVSDRRFPTQVIDTTAENVR